MGGFSSNLTSFSLMAFLLLLPMQLLVSAEISDQLKIGYYHQTCPSVETIVRKEVAKAVKKNPGLAAGLIRMYFHDCFVRGCDASLLLDSTPGNKAEKDSPANNPSLRGFEIIDSAKSELESKCPQVVSCADVLAFAARDAVHMAGGVYYMVPAGRRDGRVSIESEVGENLPSPTMDVMQLENSFTTKGLTLEEMVTLSGAHTVGVSHCSQFSDRVYNFNSMNAPDPNMDSGYVSSLKAQCPAPGSTQDPTVSLDPVTPTKLDVQYYVNLKHKHGLLQSDQALMHRRDTARMVKMNLNHPSRWANKFATAMVRIGSIDVLTGLEGEIRKSCRVIN